MSSKNIEKKIVTNTPLPIVTNTPLPIVTNTPPIVQTYDVKEETNPKIRYLMSYYGY